MDKFASKTPFQIHNYDSATHTDGSTYYIASNDGSTNFSKINGDGNSLDV